MFFFIYTYSLIYYAVKSLIFRPWTRSGTLFLNVTSCAKSVLLWSIFSQSIGRYLGPFTFMGINDVYLKMQFLFQPHLKLIRFSIKWISQLQCHAPGYILTTSEWVYGYCRFGNNNFVILQWRAMRISEICYTQFI